MFFLPNEFIIFLESFRKLFHHRFGDGLKPWSWVRSFSDLMALMRRKTWGCKYLNSPKSPEQKLFSQDDIQVLINLLLDVA